MQLKLVNYLTGEKGLASVSKKPLHYKGCVFHRVIPDFMLQVIDRFVFSHISAQAFFDLS
jgi:cyclophilin family peptidyl-prolyl cis-trans isomerase